MSPDSRAQLMVQAPGSGAFTQLEAGMLEPWLFILLFTFCSPPSPNRLPTVVLCLVKGLINGVN